MQVQGVIRSSYLSGGYDDERSRRADDQAAGNSFTARKTAFELRYGPFSLSLSRSSLQGAMPENGDEPAQPQAAPSRPRTVSQPDETGSFAMEYQRLAMSALLESVQGLSKRVEELQRTLSTIQERPADGPTASLPARFASDPSVVLSASLETDREPVAAAYGSPSSLILSYFPPAPVDSAQRFHAVA